MRVPLFLFVVGYLFFSPVPVFAISQEHFLLSPAENWQVLHSIQGHFTDQETIEFVALSGEEQAALFTIRKAVRKEFLDFLPGFVSTETVKVVLEVATSIKKISEATLTEIEKLTVEEAVRIATDWLSQKELKVASGNIADERSGIELQYVITYQEIDNNKADVVIEFYSSNSFTPPPPTVSFSLGVPYFASELPAGQVRPFIIHVKTQVQKIGLGLAIDPSVDTQVSVEFPEEVPRLELAEELPYPLEEQKINLLNKLTQAKQLLDALGAMGVDAAHTLGQGVDWAKQATEDVFSFFSEVLSVGGGAGLLDPLAAESQQLDAIESQLKEIKSQTVAQPETGEEVRLPAEDGLPAPQPAPEPAPEPAPAPEPQPVENLAELNLTEPSFEENQENLSQTKDDETKDDDTQEVSVDELGLGEDDPRPTRPSPAVCKAKPSTATALGDVVINEVGWMGAPSSANDEWIELHNRLDALVSLEGWRLQDQDAQVDVAFDSSHSISPNGFFLLERTNDESVPSVAADLVYTGALSNSEESLYLFNENCTLRDQVVAHPDWPAGDNANKKSMERNNHNLEWYTYDGQSFGSPGTTNGRDMLVGYTPPVDISFQAGVTGGGRDSSPPAQNDECGPNSIDINSASAEELEKLQGIGPVLAQRIVEEREIELFSSFDDLARVSGIAEGKVNDIKEQGCAYVDAPAEEQGQEPEPVLGCMDSEATNYNPEATQSDDSCQYAEPEPEDATSPSAAFDAPAATQSNIYFTLSWSGEDPAGEAEPSGIDKFYLQYTVTPSADGVFLQYEENDVWQSWQQGQTGELALDAAATSVSLWGQDGISYSFAIKAIDVAGNESTTETTLTELSLAKSVVINEVAWMGTAISTSDEWMELYNPGAQDIDLTGWKLEAEDGTPSIALTDTIAAGGYFLLERTNDNTISDIEATILYTGALGNGGERLQLLNAESVVIDEIAASDGWEEFGGRNENLGTAESPNWLRASMERIDAVKAGSDTANWANNNLIAHNGKDAATPEFYGSPGNWINGTPGQINSVSRSETAISGSTGGLRLTEFDSITLTKLGSPYTTPGYLTVPADKTLTVEAGVTVKLNYGFTIEGTLKAQGTADNEVVLANNTSGLWCSIRFTSSSAGSELEYTRIKNASATACGYGTHYAVFADTSAITMKNSVIEGGTNHQKIYLDNSSSLLDSITVTGADLNNSSTAIYINAGSPTIQNSTISDNSIGIFVKHITGKTTNPVIKDNTFTGNTYVVKLNSATAQLSGNTATDNTYNGTFVEGAVFEDTTWQKDTMPYFLNRFTVNQGKTLTIQAGAQIQFVGQPYSGPLLTVDGTLVTQGAAENLVVFDKASGNSNWRRLHFTSLSTGSSLTHTKLLNGGDNGIIVKEAALYIEETDAELQNVTVQDSTRAGIYADSATITGSNVTLNNNAYAFRIQTGECPELTSVSMSSAEASFYPGSVECAFE